MSVHQLIMDRYNDPSNRFHHLSRIFYIYKGKKDLANDNLRNWRPIAVLGALAVPITK